MDNIKQVECPKCGHKFLLEEFFFNKIEQELSQKFESEKKAKEQEFIIKEKDFIKKQDLLEAQQKNINELINKGVIEGISKQSKEIQNRVKADYDNQIKTLNDELNNSTKKNQELMQVQIENEKLKRSLESQRQEIELEYEKKSSITINDEVNKRLSAEKEKNELKNKEHEIMVESLTRQLKEAQQKLQQGSMQLQGEAQEVRIEEILKSLYPMDNIVEVKKGQKGGDVIHEIRNSSGAICGKIYYESKNTKDFSNEWLKKLKDDNLEIKADLCVLVTQAMPTGGENLVLINGIWVCSYGYFKTMTLAFRSFILKFNSIVQIQTNKGDKMTMLYDYLTGNEFRNQFEAIVEGFITIQKGYLDEKNRMVKIWSEREKQLDKILMNAAGFYGSIRGIAGNAIQEVKLLEDSQVLLKQ